MEPGGIDMYDVVQSADGPKLDAYTLITDFHHPTKAPEPREDFINRYRIHVTELFDGHLRRLRRDTWQGN